MLTSVSNNLAWKTAKEAAPWNRRRKMAMGVTAVDSALCFSRTSGQTVRVQF